MSAAAGDVLRGMEVLTAPRRLIRDRDRGVPALAPNPGAAAPAVEQEPWRKVFDEAREQGWQEGLRTGQEEGRRRAQAEIAALAKAEIEKSVAHAVSSLQQEQARACQLIASFGTALEDCIAAAEDELVALCFDSVCRVLGSRCLQPEHIREQVRSCLAAWRDAGDAITVRLHPEDAAMMEAAVAGWPPALRCLPDAGVAMGGCLLVGSRGGLDLRLDTTIATLKDTLLQVRASRAALRGVVE